MILVCGEALVDMFVENSAGRLHIQTMAGGSPLNVAVGLCRLGRSAAFLSTLSDDAFGIFLEQHLQESGVDLRFVRRCSDRTTLSVVAADRCGHPRYSFYGGQNADRALQLDDLPPALPDAVTAIMAGSYALGVEPIATALRSLLFREAGNRAISLDPNVRPHLVPSIMDVRRRFEDLVPLADIVKASSEDIDALYGGDNVEDIARRWQELGARLVVVTRGPAGASAYTAGGQRVSRPARPVEVVDTVGAGDSFHAALLAYLDERGLLVAGAAGNLSEEDIANALDFASTAAAITCSRRGACPPTSSEVEQAQARSDPSASPDVGASRVAAQPFDARSA